jgi:hypothetical protein
MLVAGQFEAMAHNNVLEPTRLSRLEIEGGFGFVDSLPAKILLQTRLAAQHWPLGSGWYPPCFRGVGQGKKI